LNEQAQIASVFVKKVRQSLGKSRKYAWFEKHKKPLKSENRVFQRTKPDKADVF